MPRKKKKQNDLKNLIILLIAVLLILMLIVMISVILDNIKYENAKNDKDNSINVVINAEEIAKSENEEELNKIKQMSERNRIEYYVSQFIKDLEEENFEEAYAVLNNDFKKNYFSTMRDFKEYSKNKFTKMLDVDYINFERTGEIYVIWLRVTDAINGDKNSGEEMNFVVKENDFNDFELSFSVN